MTFLDCFTAYIAFGFFPFWIGYLLIAPKALANGGKWKFPSGITGFSSFLFLIVLWPVSCFVFYKISKDLDHVK